MTDELKRLVALVREKGRPLTANDVVDDARHDESPLHAYFDWAPDESSETKRINSAIDLIGAYSKPLAYEYLTISLERFAEDITREFSSDMRRAVSCIRSVFARIGGRPK